METMRSMHGLRAFRRRYGLCGLLQIHHLIPQHLGRRIVGFDVHDGRNLLFMPTRLGMEELRLHPTRLVHDGGHSAYNRYVAARLEHATNLTQLMDELRAELRRPTPQLPW